MTRKRALWLAGLAAGTALATAKAPAAEATPPPELTRTVTGLDAALFDAYNHCELAKLGGLVAEDLEFYHDQTGLSRGRQLFLDAIRNNICGKVHRDLLPATLEVYPLKNYGALELGAHVFCEAQLAKCDPAKSGSAKFVMLWQHDGGRWKLTRVISYEHLSEWQRPRAAAPETP